MKPSRLQELQSIDAGPFAVPIGGRFRVSQESGATVFSTEDESRHITVAVFSAARPQQSGQARAATADLLQRGWSRFAEREGLRVVLPFRAFALRDGLKAYMQGAEWDDADGLRHYINCALTDGMCVATFIVEGPGDALAAARGLDAAMAAVRYRASQRGAPD